jgi:hypothetical protein
MSPGFVDHNYLNRILKGERPAEPVQVFARADKVIE